MLVKNIANKNTFGYASPHQRRTNHAAVVQKQF
nr:MAG TPA_asm: Flagella basal body rod protein [Caudoviricetes sp.]